MPAYDVFLSHAWADGQRPQQIYDALTGAGLRVWFDAEEINDFASITNAVTRGLAQSKALLAYYSKTYPLRRACQWELTAAFLAAQTEGDPRRRVLVINPEAGAGHIHPVTLRDAKFRTAPGNGAALQELVQSVVEHVATLDGLLADIHPLNAPTWYGTTPVGSTRFVGRLEEMWQVHSLLNATDVAQITGATVNIGQVSGLGGVGKSLLAEEYALHFGAAYPGGVFWVRAYGNDDAKAALGQTEREALRADQVRQMAERLGIDTRGMTPERVEGELATAIEQRGQPCLWVVDDVPNGLDGEALRHWFSPQALARTLITTRSREYGSLARSIDLSVLAPEESYQLLTSRRQPGNEAEEQQARLLANDLGQHALALDVTASALPSSVAAAPFADFRARLARPEKDALALAETLADALPNGHEKSIAQTILRSIRNLGEEGVDFLRLASVLAVAPIPAELVSGSFERADQLSQGDAEERASLAFQQVTSASLAEITGAGGNARSVHTLVSRTVRFREQRSPERTAALRMAAVAVLEAEIGKVADDARLHKQIEFLVPHARQLLSSPTTAQEADLMAVLSSYDIVRGAYSAGEALCLRELELRRQQETNDTGQMCASMSRLGAAFRKQGAFAKARAVQEEALALAQGEFGSDALVTLNCMNNLGVTLRNQGDLATARKLQQEQLEICRLVFGPKHESTLAVLVNLGSTLWAQGDLAEAQEMQRQALTVCKVVFGPEHQSTLTTANNLANTLLALGNFAEARKLHEESLEVRRRVMGKDHPETLESLNNLAETMSAQGDFAAARKINEEALKAIRRVLGSEHPNTLSLMNNLAGTLRHQGDKAGARELLEETLSIRRRVLGPEHPDTLVSMSMLAETLRAQKDFAAARNLQEELLSLRWRTLGPEHPKTLLSLNNLASTLSAQGDQARACRIYANVVETERRVLGPDHPDTSVSAWNLFAALLELGEREAAVAVFRRDLVWLLERDPACLGADQCEVREAVAQVVGKVDGK